MASFAAVTLPSVGTRWSLSRVSLPSTTSLEEALPVAGTLRVAAVPASVIAETVWVWTRLALPASEFVTVVANEASLPRAAASSFSVSKAAGAAFTTAATAEETSEVRAMLADSLASGSVPLVSRLAFVVGGAAAITALVKSEMSAATCWWLDGVNVEGLSVMPAQVVVPAGPVGPAGP